MEATSRPESFVEMLRHLREPYLIASTGGAIIAANVAAAEALGTSIAALEGGALADYSPDPVGLRDRLAQQPGNAPFPLRGRDGHRFTCDTSALPGGVRLLRLSGGPESVQRGVLFSGLLAQLRTTGGEFPAQALEELSNAVLARGMHSLGIVAGGLYLLDATGANLELKGSAGYAEQNVDRYRILPLTPSTPMADAIRQRRPVFLTGPEDIATHYPGFAASYAARRAAAIACIPLQVHGRTIGGIGLGFPEPRAFDAKDERALRALAQQCAEVFEWAERLEEAPAPSGERAMSRLERLHVFTRALAQAVTPAHVAEAVVDMGMAATSARSGGLWLLSEDGSTVTLERSVGPGGPRAADYVRVPLESPQRMPILDAIREGEVVWIESCHQLEARYPEVFRRFSEGGESALACIPLFAQGRCIGGLAYNFLGGRCFDEDERTFLHLISWHSAHAIERSRLHADQTRAREAAIRSQKRSDFLAETGTLLASSLDYSSTLAGLAQAAVPRIADFCVVDLEEQRQKGLPAVASHIDPSKVSLVLQLNARMRVVQARKRETSTVLRSGQGKVHRYTTPEEVLAWARGDAELCELFGRLGMVSSMTAPISARGRTFGVMALISADATRTYDEDDLAMAVELGRIAGLAIDNARLYQEAREADRQKDEFLAMLSHELRNPLTPIVTAVELMKVRDPDAFSKERAIIARNANHIVRLVDDLLDVARLTRGKVDLHSELCELSSLIANAVETASPLVEERAQRLTVSAPARGIAVMADPIRLTQAIMNLLANAAKYTGRGGEISVVALVENAEAVLRVRDSGIGIAPEMLPLIFGLFVQERGTLDRARGGLGVGLTVVKTLVELHGGAVSAHSEGRGKGSEFVIRLPLAREGATVAVDPATMVSRPPPAATDEGLRVLVIDDNVDATNLLGEAFGMFGCAVRLAHDGASGLLAAAAFEPDLALVDIGLPILNGYEVAERLRRLDVAPKRIVAVSGYGQRADRTRSIEAGFDDHIVKPLGLEALRKLVTTAKRE